MGGNTDTFGSEEPRGGSGGVEWALAVALDCERLAAPPSRVSLARVDEVDIGRGAERSVSREDRRVRIDLPDRWASERHARLQNDGTGWVVEDAGSKNGTRLNGRRVARAAVADGDVVECGGTFLVLRRAVGPIGDLAEPAGRGETLRTLSPTLERELAILAKIAKSRVPVLVRGESGTGKEVAASAIHTLSGRTGPLVPVNCGAIPATLVESELFGSRRGAFSGAEDRPGLVRNADHGTLFLDEIAELPPTAQATLLRVLQDGEVLPLGAGKRIIVDVRVVSATNQPVEGLVEDGRFRRDLYARLRGYELILPPLSSRLEDLGLLVASLLTRLEPDAPIRKLSREAARALFTHPWRFHVRELEQTLRAAVAVAATSEIGLDDLRLSAARPPETAAGSDAQAKDQLVALLERHGGNLSAISRELKTSRSQVLRLLARHALVHEEYKRR